MSRWIVRLSTAAVVGLALAAMPLGFGGQGFDNPTALAKGNGNGGGNGNAGGNGNGKGGGHGNAGGFGDDLSAESGGPGKGHGNGKALGLAKAETGQSSATAGSEPVGESLGKAWGQAKKSMNAIVGSLFGEEEEEGKKKNTAGRLNGFLHAAPQAIENSAPNSAIGSVAQGYGAALAAYLGAAVEEPPAEEPLVEEEEEVALTPLEEAAKALVDAANKPLDAETVAAVNAKLAELNEDPAFDGLEDPTSEQSMSLAEDIVEAAAEFEAAETEQGLGNNQTLDGEDELSESDDDVATETDLAEQPSDETIVTQ